ncbi:probable CYB2-lactate dehydrogenase cytochrome b2 [Phialocephala subalpina]|uniref:Probable CYB2-lactate dehydrogenase cytochrome b2 n=1 Tax=Phialocephala subalpina TaxID=576137 RepID=A0A1L7X112_9HELO|nr:probable CYB2-lactate dehydrogenase cytochrome b2 [Phialocephala subalpina]
MHSFLTLLPLLASALAARPFLNEPDTGIEDVLGDIAVGTLPPLESIVGLPDFEWAARGYMNTSAYTYYRNGAAGEWSYRNNLEVYNRFRLRPRVLTDITNIESTLPTTILGHNFSAPFFISPCARAGYAHPEAEAGLIRGAAANGILYMPALYAILSIEQIAAAKPANSTQVTFQQVYLDTNNIASQAIFKRAEKAGSKAIIFTVDSAADGNRHRAARYGVGSADSSYSYMTWDVFHTLQNLTSLPIIPKGIMTVEDAQLAVANGAKAIIISNHGGRQLDVFTQVEVYADGGVRYGADVLKLLSLGVKAVGLGRPFMFANAYGQEGVEKAITLLKHEIAIDAGNLGVGDLKKIDPSFVSWTNNNWYS